MRDIVAMIFVAFFWFLLSMSFTAFALDETITDISISQQGNASTSIIDTDSLNATNIEAGDETSSSNFISMWFRIITFRIPSNLGLPSLLTFIINAINFILVATFGLMMYRQGRSGSG